MTALIPPLHSRSVQVPTECSTLRLFLNENYFKSKETGEREERLREDRMSEVWNSIQSLHGRDPSNHADMCLPSSMPVGRKPACWAQQDSNSGTLMLHVAISSGSFTMIPNAHLSLEGGSVEYCSSTSQGRNSAENWWTCYSFIVSQTVTLGTPNLPP